MINRLLRNRSVIVTPIKTQDIMNGHSPVEEEMVVDPMEGVRVAAAYADVAKDLITHAALTIGSVWAACKIIERICR